MGIDLTAGIVRICDTNYNTVGTGFVFSEEGLIATCAHVIDTARAKPDDIVHLVFYHTGDKATASIEPEGWSNEEQEDVAILRLNEPLPIDVKALPLGLARHAVGHCFASFGFPNLAPHPGRHIRGGDIDGLIKQDQILQISSTRIAPGDSGAPVVDTRTGRAVGMINQFPSWRDKDKRDIAGDRYGRNTDVNYAIPTEVLLKVWPSLSQYIPAQPDPTKSLFKPHQHDIPTFSGRDAELTHLQNILLNRENKMGAGKIVGLWGVGGVGKSALAIRFATLHQADFPDGIFSQRVEDKDINNVAREFAHQAGYVIDREDERDAYNIMQETFASRHALLIFDNAENDGIKALLPYGDNCTVIITTRDQTVLSLLRIPVEAQIKIPPLPSSDAQALLGQWLGKERVAAELKATQEIIELVGGLPIALRSVGAILADSTSRLSLTDYATLLQQEFLSALDKPGIERSVRACFSLSLKHLKPEQVDFFACLSVCAKNGFSLQTARVVGGYENPKTQWYLDTLCQLSLLNQVEAGGSRYVFHTLLHLFAQEQAKDPNLKDAAAQRHAEYFVNLAPEGAAQIEANLDDFILAVEWLLQQQKPNYDFVLGLKHFFQGYGYWQRAEELMGGFMTLAEHNQDWPQAAEFGIQQARFCSFCGNSPKAEKILKSTERIIDYIASPLEQQHSRAKLLHSLGSIYRNQGRLEEAYNALECSLKIGQELDDKSHIAVARRSLGGLYLSEGRLDEALEAFEHSRQLGEQLEDTKHLGIVLNSLGDVYLRLRRRDEAFRAFQDSVQICETLPDKRLLANALNGLGRVYIQQECLDKALEALQRSYKIQEGLGNRIGMAITLKSLGKVYLGQKLLSEAFEAYRDSYGIQKELKNKDGMTQALNGLGEVYLHQENFEAALDTFHNSIELCEQLEEGRSEANALRRSKAIALQGLGKVHERKKDFDIALDFYRQSYEIRKKRKDYYDRVIILDSIGKLCLKRNRLGEALNAFEEKAWLFQALKDRPQLAITFNIIGNIHQSLNNSDKALEVYERSCQISEILEDKRQLAITLNIIGNIHQSLNNFDKALKVYERSRQISEALRDESQLLITLNSMGNIYLKKYKRLKSTPKPRFKPGKTDRTDRTSDRFLNEAFRILQRSLQIGEELPDEPSLVITLNILGNVYVEKDLPNKATECFQQSIQIGKGLKEDQLSISVVKNLGEAYLSQKLFDQVFDTFQGASQFGKEPSNRRYLAKVYTKIGRGLQTQNNFKLAADALRQSFEIGESLQDGQHLVVTTFLLARVLDKLGLSNEALSYCQKTLRRNITPINKKYLSTLKNKLSLPPESRIEIIVTGTIEKIIQHRQGYRYGFIIPDEDEYPNIFFSEPYIDVDQLDRGVRVKAEIFQDSEKFVAKWVEVIDTKF